MTKFIIGDWGLGIGDWPNPQSPIPKFNYVLTYYLFHFIKNNIL